MSCAWFDEDKEMAKWPFQFIIYGIPNCGIIVCGWYRYPAQHDLCRLSRGRLRPRRPAGTSAVLDSSMNHDSADRISGQFLFYHNHNFTKSKGFLRFCHLVPLFIPIGICIMMHDGTASDVTIGM